MSAPKRISAEKGAMMKHVLFLLLACVGFAGSASAYTLSWKANTEPDLAGYRLFMKVGSCINNPTLWGKPVKTFGLVTSGTYNTTITGPKCFQLKAFDKTGNVSKPDKSQWVEVAK
jgi:hypothetical protein